MGDTFLPALRGLLFLKAASFLQVFLLLFQSAVNVCLLRLKTASLLSQELHFVLEESSVFFNLAQVALVFLLELLDSQLKRVCLLVDRPEFHGRLLLGDVKLLIQSLDLCLIAKLSLCHLHLQAAQLLVQNYSLSVLLGHLLLVVSLELFQGLALLLKLCL